MEEEFEKELNWRDYLTNHASNWGFLSDMLIGKPYKNIYTHYAVCTTLVFSTCWILHLRILQR